MTGKSAVLIAGPTASGKSALALERARESGGVIVNADAMQVYDGLRLLTARPSEADVALAPHRLYGMVSPGRAVLDRRLGASGRKIIAEAGDAPLIFVGGTGLYFAALTEGFADVPEVPAEAVAWATAEVARARSRGAGPADRRARSGDCGAAQGARSAAGDPGAGGVAGDGPVAREFPGRCAAWACSRAGGSRRSCSTPSARCCGSGSRSGSRRWSQFGAVDEVRTLLDRGLDPSLPVMKAIGVPEISAFLRGEIDAPTMVERAVTASRQYAKRQRTWFRNRMADWTWV